MRIDNWPLNKIMQLPDWCFGRRYPVGVAVRTPISAIGWDMSEVGLSERAVLWEVTFWAATGYTDLDNFRLALGDRLPTAQAEMDLYEQLLKGVGRLAATRRHLLTNAAEVIHINRIRMPVEAGGRKVILEATPDNTKAVEIQVVTIWSSMPKEVPDWLVSAQGENL